MKIHVLASGSTGNCYWISDGKTSILLECGIKLLTIQKKLKFGVSNLDGVLVSHAHRDHCLCIKDLMRYGIHCYTGQDTANELAVSGYRFHALTHGKQFEVGTFKIVPFNLPHINTDETPCSNLGYLVYSTITQEYLLFATDCMYISERYPACHYYLIEMNYTESLDDEFIPAVEKRRYRSHMSLQTALGFLEHQDLSKCKKIYAIHTSRNRCDTDEIKQKIKDKFNKDVIIA